MDRVSGSGRSVCAQCSGLVKAGQPFSSGPPRILVAQKVRRLIGPSSTLLAGRRGESCLVDDPGRNEDGHGSGSFAVRRSLSRIACFGLPANAIEVSGDRR